MKKQILFLGLSLMSFNTFANSLETTQCLKSLNNANNQISSLQSELRSCQTSRPGPGGGREDANMREQLKAERQQNFDLNQTIKGLQRENSDLRYRIQQLERYSNDQYNGGGYGDGYGGQTTGYFAVAGCVNGMGRVDLRYTASAESSRKLEVESQAIEGVKRKYNCARGIAIHQIEELRTSNKEARYCRAACADGSGNPALQYMKSATGRNTLEAQFKAVENVAKVYSCAQGIVVKDCE